MRTSQKEILVEDEEELIFMEMEEIGKHSRDLSKILDKIEIG